MIKITTSTIKVSYDDYMITKDNVIIPKVTVVDGNMFDIVRYLYNTGKKVTLHNFANNNRPGLYKISDMGDIYFTSHTQEEQLLRASMKSKKIFLDINQYLIYIEGKNSALYTKDVLFCKDFITGFRVRRKQRFLANVCTSPAIQNPKVNPQTGKYENQVDKDSMLKRMMLTLFLALRSDPPVADLNVRAGSLRQLARDSDVFITGCGAFNNPIQEVKDLWNTAIRSVLETAKEIIFVIYVGTRTISIWKDIEQSDRES